MVKIKEELYIKYNLTALIFTCSSNNKTNIIKFDKHKFFNAMSTKHLIVIILFLFIIKTVQAQNENQCKVLHENLQVFYEGDCKDGLAHGEGFAKGIDEYKGKFKNGLPHGHGLYTFKNGDTYEGRWKEGKRNGKGTFYNKETDKKVLGMWKDDVMIKEIKEPDYQVLRSDGITGVSFQERHTATPGIVEVVFQRDGNESRTASGLIINTSSGNLKMSGYFSGVENAEFPLEGRVEFRAPNRFNTVMVKYELQFKINKKSSWKIVIRY